MQNEMQDLTALITYFVYLKQNSTFTQNLIGMNLITGLLTALDKSIMVNIFPTSSFMKTWVWDTNWNYVFMEK